MKVAGVVVEYNPFHNGHMFHLEETRRVTGADYVVGVMSPDYVQRGVPAMVDKHTRARMALAGGIDLILELPVCYATSSAMGFAQGAVGILDGLSCVDFCCFGSESGDLETFLDIARILEDEPEVFREALGKYLKQGDSFPLARRKALCAYGRSDWETFLASPNNILGLAYVRQLLKLNSTIKPVTITRCGNGYHEDTLTGVVSSATAIRKGLAEGMDVTSMRDQFPEDAFSLLEEAVSQKGICHEDDFSLLLHYKLLQESSEHLSTYMDVSGELAHRIVNRLNDFQTFSQFADLLKTRELTRTRINRALLHILLGIQELEPITYARILGFRESALPLLTYLKKNSTLPLLTKVSNEYYNPFAANLYSVVCQDKGMKYVHEFSKAIVKVD
jgi:predicted nucleotidyltransferase